MPAPFCGLSTRRPERQKMGISVKSDIPEVPAVPMNGAAAAQEVVKAGAAKK